MEIRLRHKVIREQVQDKHTWDETAKESSLRATERGDMKLGLEGWVGFDVIKVRTQRTNGRSHEIQNDCSVRCVLGRKNPCSLRAF